MKRYLVSLCCKCRKEMGRKPLPKDYGVGSGFKSLMLRDVVSHGICESCSEILYPWYKLYDKK